MVTFGRLVVMLAALAAPGMNAALAGENRHAATLASPAQKVRLVAHGLLWRCAGERCVAPAGNSRPMTVCQALAREAGTVTSFSTAGEALPAEQLARCNNATPQAQTAAAR